MLSGFILECVATARLALFLAFLAGAAVGIVSTIEFLRRYQSEQRDQPPKG